MAIKIIEYNTIIGKRVSKFKPLLYFCLLSKNGDVAQLARAFDWQSRGRGFESHLLHQKKLYSLVYQGFRVFV
jgi:hypothetical protein